MVVLITEDGGFQALWFQGDDETVDIVVAVQGGFEGLGNHGLACVGTGSISIPVGTLTEHQFRRTDTVERERTLPLPNDRTSPGRRSFGKLPFALLSAADDEAPPQVIRCSAI